MARNKRDVSHFGKKSSVSNSEETDVVSRGIRAPYGQGRAEGGILGDAMGTWLVRWYDIIRADFLHAVWNLVKEPGLFAIATVTLSLGIGINTAIFSLINAVLLRPLSYDKSARVVALFENDRSGNSMLVSAQDFGDWRSQNKSFDELAAYQWGTFDFISGDEADRVIGAAVTPSFFRVFGLAAQVGTTFEARQAGDPSSAVISESLWKTRFGKQPVLGRTLRVFGDSYTIVGIIPSFFDFPGSAQLWIPLDLSRDKGDRSAHKYRVVARLKSDRTLPLAAADLSAIASRLEYDFPKSNAGVRANLVSLRDLLSNDVRPSLLLLFSLVLLVLFIATANVAGLILVRTESRQREFAIRLASGASRVRIGLQLFIESTLLSLGAGILGLVLSYWITKSAVSLIPVNLQPSQRPTIDVVVLAFVGFISMTVALLSTLPSAIRGREDDVANLPKPTTIGSRSLFLRNALVSGEIALSLLLLVGAGLATRNLLLAEDRDLGFKGDGLLLVDATMANRGANDEARETFYRLLTEQLTALPGVESAAATNDPPLTGVDSKGSVLIENHFSDSLPTEAWAGLHLVSDNFFRTLRIPVKEGRDFLERGREDANVAVIDENTARRYWPNESAIGKHIALPGLDEELRKAQLGQSSKWLTVVGVVGTVQYEGPAIAPGLEVYLPFDQHPAAFGHMYVLVRSRLSTVNLEKDVKHIVRPLNADTVVQIKGYNDLLKRTIETSRFRSLLLSSFATLAIILVCVGISGLISYSVALRSKEIALRIAVGSPPQRIVKLVMRDGFRVILSGIVAGFVLVSALAPWTTRYLQGAGGLNVSMLATATLLLIVVTFCACYIPARGAMKIDPAGLLRSE